MSPHKRNGGEIPAFGGPGSFDQPKLWHTTIYCMLRISYLSLNVNKNKWKFENSVGRVANIYTESSFGCDFLFENVFLESVSSAAATSATTATSTAASASSSAKPAASWLAGA